LIYFAEPVRFQIMYPVSSWISHLARTVGLPVGSTEMLLTPNSTIAAFFGLRSRTAG
jgi:hypothetical protein